ncbi:MAG TPA: acyl-CoA thioesterase II [Candidatus Stackebrandtia faecavium]|nr:acyl-CoA thioesterase II [Candidatus Stackebrandtia faecavium]
MTEEQKGQQELDELLNVLDLERIENNIYRGIGPQVKPQRVFGGQVAGQALVAAGRTTDSSRKVHSLHGYFVRPGDSRKPIVYEVEPIRDGRSFSVRRVSAIQDGKTIFFMSVSFHVGEEGLEHAEPMPKDVPNPRDLPPLSTHAEKIPNWIDIWPSVPGPIDMRYVGSSGFVPSGQRPPSLEQRVWMRADGKLPDDQLLHVCILTYVSDLTLLDSVLNRHGQVWGAEGYGGTSLDHALWFHRHFRADEWFLYDSMSPSAASGRGLARGQFFTENGDHIATAVQEGLLRRAPQGWRNVNKA